MLKTLRLSFSLKNTYRVNTILYAIRQIPLIKRIIPSTVYRIQGFKIFANVLSVIWEILTVFLGKVLYFLIMIVGAAELLNVSAESGAQLVLHLLLVPFFVAGVKMAFTVRQLIDYEKYGTVNNENKLSKLWWIVFLLLLGAAYGLPAIGFMIPELVSVICMCVGILLGLLSLRKILTFAHYRPMYKELLADEVVINPVTAQNIQTDQSRNKISTDVSINSNRKGVEYLNELFIKRHQKLLWKSVERIAAVVLALIAIALIALKFVPEIKSNLNGMLMTYLPYMVFVMYAINRGTGFTQALFINCDHSLLTYSFYKQPRNILKLFWIRLREIIKVNLLPSYVIGVGLALLLFATGGTDNPLNYVVLFVSVVAMSVFFSMHYLTLYYLLQPYNAGTEIKSGTYQFITGATYFVCYMMMQVKMSTLIFGVMIIAFCVIYCIAASVLVYIFAPKTFRIRA